MSAATLLAGTLVVSLNAYVLLGGADFGGGVWDLLASGPRKDAQRQLIGAQRPRPRVATGGHAESEAAAADDAAQSAPPSDVTPA